jgi:hypothetical protein
MDQQVQSLGDRISIGTIRWMPMINIDYSRMNVDNFCNMSQSF